jgi:hypothetical protein
MPSSPACRPTPGAPQHARGPGRAIGERLCRQRGRIAPQAPALRASHSGPATTLRPQPATQGQALLVPRAELAIPRSLPPCRRRILRSRWSARSAARTNDLEVRQDDGHTRPRGRPGVKDHRESHSTRRALHRPRRTPAEPLDTKRLSICTASANRGSIRVTLQIRMFCATPRSARPVPGRRLKRTWTMSRSPGSPDRGHVPVRDRLGERPERHLGADDRSCAVRGYGTASAVWNLTYDAGYGGRSRRVRRIRGLHRLSGGLASPRC